MVAEPALIEVLVRGDLTDNDAENMWRMYDAAFIAKRTENPCRQYFRNGDFMDAMKDPEVVKIIGTADGEVTFFCLLTRNFDRIPWIEEAYYAHHWPQFVGHMIYIPAIFVPLSLQGMGYFRPLMDAIQRYVWANDIHAVFYDHGGEGVTRLLTDMIVKTPHVRRLGPFGTQIYSGVETYQDGKWPGE